MKEIAAALPLKRCHSRDVDDVVNRATAGEIIGRLAQTLQDGTDRSGSGEALGQLVSNIAGLKVGEY